MQIQNVLKSVTFIVSLMLPAVGLNASPYQAESVSAKAQETSPSVKKEVRTAPPINESKGAQVFTKKSGASSERKPEAES